MDQIRPGLFGKAVAADSRRIEFDFLNEQLLYLGRRPDILFGGDSITHYWDLNAYFGVAKCLVNRGIGGDTTEYILRRFDADVIQLRPKLVVLMAGTNDFFATHCDPWWRTTGADTEAVLAGIQANFAAIVEKCQQAGVRLALCSVLPSDIAPPFDKRLWWELTARLNRFLQGLCAEHGLTYVDYHAKLCQADGRTLIYELSPDGIHPNARGYEIMARVLRGAIGL